MNFLEPTPASRRKFALFFLATIVGGAFVIELATAYLAGLKSRPTCEASGPALVMWICVLAGLLLCSAVATWTARKALKLDQWPLPGTWVLRRTPIRHGRAVAWRAYALLAWAALVVAFVGYASYVSWGFVQRVEAHCGVTTRG